MVLKRNTMKSVRFSSKASIREIDPVDKDVAWISDEEMQEIKQRATEVVNALRSKSFVEDEENCAHGLTGKVYPRLVRLRKTDALFSVLDEQSVQREVMEEMDHELIADVYFESTRLNQKMAELRGKQTAHEVRISWESGPSCYPRSFKTNNSSRKPVGLPTKPLPRISTATCA
eukprot:scaffold22613_cov126-Cylindrotheca_fusiformis.AAC.10